MALAVDIASLILIMVTLLPLIETGKWWIRIWDYPRLQIAAALALALVLEAWLSGAGTLPRVLLLLALAACAIYQLVQILSYTPLATVEVPWSEDAPFERRISILLANVLMSNRNADDLIAILDETDPDLFLAAETDAWWDRQLAPVSERFAHAMRCPLDNTYGMHFFSKLPLHNEHFRFLLEEDIPSVYAEVQLRSGEWIDFFGVHPRPPRPAQDTEPRDAELLIVGREARASPLASIVAGDLNDVAWSHTTRLFQRTSGLIDPRVGRGFYSTFHASVPLLRWPLDHLFHDPRFQLCRLERLRAFGSDHFPVLIELAYEPERAQEAARPEPDPQDHEEARRKILKAVPLHAWARIRQMIAARRHAGKRGRPHRFSWRRRRPDDQ